MKLINRVQTGKRAVYDIEVEEVHEFYANKVLVHNCATNGGVSVIKDNGTVVDIVFLSHSVVGSIEFIDNDKILFGNDTWDTGRFIKVYKIPSSDMSENYGYFKNNALEAYQVRPDGTADITLPTGTGSLLGIANRNFATNNGLALIDPNIVNPANGSSAVITSDYNTGWMNGDIKLATLSDTDDTDVVGTELVTNGTFDSDVSGWSDFGGTIAYNSGRAEITTTSYYGALQALTVEVGKTYILSFTTASGTSSARIRLGDASNGLKYLNDALADGDHSYTITATDNTTMRIFLSTANASGTCFFDNISVRLAEEDRSVNGNGLQVFGTVTKNPVATGADLVGYSGWSEDNYLYNPSIPAFSTGDYFMSTWFKPESNGASYSHLVSIDGQSDSTGVTLKIHHTNGNSVYFYGNATTLVTSAQSLSYGQWYCISGGRVNGVWKIYLNGLLSATGSNNAFGVGGSSTCSVMVGHNPSVGAEFTQGQQALLRVSATFPSDAQIKKMYEDEKPLFQENAQATLYGTSDAVTALAYDDDTELLHAGTSSGRSVFQGLRRVSNTTDAVTTSISASNSIIVEE